GRAVRRTTAGIGRTIRAIGGTVTACRTVVTISGTTIGTTVIAGGGIGVLGDRGSGLELVRERQRVVVPPRPLGVRLQPHIDRHLSRGVLRSAHGHRGLALPRRDRVERDRRGLILLGAHLGSLRRRGRGRLGRLGGESL